MKTESSLEIQSETPRDQLRNRLGQQHKTTLAVAIAHMISEEAQTDRQKCKDILGSAVHMLRACPAGKMF